MSDEQVTEALTEWPEEDRLKLAARLINGTSPTRDNLRTLWVNLALPHRGPLVDWFKQWLDG